MKTNSNAINMAKINQGILGGFIGQVGSVIGSVWKGKSVIRARAQHIHDPKTSRQLLSRQRFAMLQHLVALVGYENVRIGFKAKARFMTEANYFIKRNYGVVTGTEPDNLSITYADVMVAEGTLPGIAPSGAPTSDDPNTASLRWVNNDGVDGASSADQVILLAVDPEGGITATFQYNRSQSSADLDLPAYMHGHSVHFYGFCVGVGTKKPSNSVYFGKVTIS